jgi:hypothetical protein
MTLNGPNIRFTDVGSEVTLSKCADLQYTSGFALPDIFVLEN